MHDHKRPSDQAMWSKIVQLPRRRNVVAAVCYREVGTEFEFLLVRTRSGRWTFPKGGIERGETPAFAAAREAQEEAGVLGHIESEAFALYRYCKSNLCGRSQMIAVKAFLCRVVATVAPMEDFRDPTWFTAPEAKVRLGEGRPPQFATDMKMIVDVAMGKLLCRMTGS